MNRRGFLRAAGIGSGLLAMPTVSLATFASAVEHAPLTILRPAALPEAVAYASSVAAALAADGRPAPRLVDCDGSDAVALSALLSAEGGGSVLGVMQPSGAVVAVALASAHGLGLRWEGRIAPRDSGGVAGPALSSFILDR